MRDIDGAPDGEEVRIRESRKSDAVICCCLSFVLMVMLSFIMCRLLLIFHCSCYCILQNLLLILRIVLFDSILFHHSMKYREVKIHVNRSAV